MAHPHMTENNCVKLFFNPSTIAEVMVRTNSDRRCAHIHQTVVVTTVSFDASRLDKKSKFCHLVKSRNLFLLPPMIQIWQNNGYADIDVLLADDGWLAEWCFMPLSTVFQSYHCDSSHYSCLSRVSPVLGLGSEVSCPKTLPRKKTQRIQCCSNPGALDYKSNTLPLSHARPLIS